MQKIFEDIKFDIGLVSQAINNSNVTGKYHPLAEHRKVLAILSGGAMAKTKTTILQLYQATNAEAGSAKVITVGTCTITANINSTHLQVTLATVLNTETITINGLLFTAHTDTTVLADRQFSIATGDAESAVELCLCINDPTYGVPGVLAESTLGVVQLTSESPGETLITAVSTDATFTVVTVEAQSYVEIDPLILDLTFTHIACKVTTTADTNVAVVLIRGLSRKKITQKVGGKYPA